MRGQRNRGPARPDRGWRKDKTEREAEKERGALNPDKQIKMASVHVQSVMTLKVFKFVISIKKGCL